MELYTMDIVIQEILLYLLPLQISPQIICNSKSNE